MHRCILHILILFLLTLQVACGVSSPTVGTTVATKTASPTARIKPLASSTVPVKTPTYTPASTETMLPSPTATIQPSATPGGQLAQPGPWLLLQQEIKFPEAGQGPVVQYFVSDADGSNLQPVGLPVLPPDRYWIGKSTPRGRCMAFRTMGTANDPFELRADGLDDFLWIVRLPENIVILKIPLLGQAAWKQVNKEIAQGADLLGTPPAVGLAQDPGSFQWNPDGRLLAFSSAGESETNGLYVYNCEDNTVRLLTNTKDSAQPWFWSTDGKWLIYREGKSIISEIRPTLGDVTGVFALSLDGGKRKLYTPVWNEEVAGIAMRSFYVYQSAYEGDPSNLRRVDIPTGQVEVLYQGNFTSTAIEPSQGVVLLRFQKGIWASGYDREDGIYRLRQANHRLELVMIGEFLRIKWLDDWQVFESAEGEPKGSSPGFYFQFGANGNVEWMKQETPGIPSPDNRWSVHCFIPFGYEEGCILRIASSDEKMVKDLEPGWYVHWLSDSSGFYGLHCEGGCGLYLYRQDRGWQAVQLATSLRDDNIIAGLSDYWLIQP